MSTTDDPSRDGPVVADRPSPGTPRPTSSRPSPSTDLANGLSVLVADLPGRPLVSALADRDRRRVGRAAGRGRGRPSSPPAR